MSQKQDVLSYLQKGNPITPIEALNMFGSFRLSAIIFSLRDEGYDIKTTIVKLNEKRFASYSLVILKD